MAVDGFESSLSSLRGATVEVSNSGLPPDPGAASVQLRFSSGTRLRVDYWRTVARGKAGVSSFDHGQRYGLPAPIDAFAELRRVLSGRSVTEARWEPSTGDLVFVFDADIEFQAFNLTGYEVWEIHFPDGTGEYSNYAR